MQIIVKGRHLDLTDPIKDYVDEKVRRIERYFEWATKVEAELSMERNPRIADNQIVEITIFANHGSVIRAKQGSPDMYTSVDKIVEKLQKQLKKYKEKLETVQKDSIRLNKELEYEEEEEQELPVQAGGPDIVKIKQFTIKPMSPEEAAMEMELLGHMFFFFTNAETEKPNVLYKRRDGDYGLIESSQ